MGICSRAAATALGSLLIGACFTEQTDDDDDDADATTGNTSAPTSSTTSPTASTTDPTSSTSATDPTTVTDTAETTQTDPTDPDSSTGVDPCSSGVIACGDGAFTPGELCFDDPLHILAGADHVGEIVVADLDGDARAEVVVADGEAGAWIVYGADDLGAAEALDEGFAGWSADVGRFQDRNILAIGGAGGVVRIYDFADGQPTMNELPGPPGFAVARFGDFEGDGDVDLMVVSDESNEVWIYLRDGVAGGFDQHSTAMLSSPVADIRVVRQQGSEVPGLAWLTTDGRLLVSPPSPSPFEGVTQVHPAQTYGEPNSGALAVGEINDDGIDDIVVGYDGRAFVFESAGFSYGMPTVLGDSVAGGVEVAVADVDGDGSGDVLRVHEGVSEVVVQPYVAGEFVDSVRFGTQAGPMGVYGGSVDGDCAPDIVAVGVGWLSVYRPGS